MMERRLGTDRKPGEQRAPDPGFRVLSLLSGIVLALLLTFYPHIALDRWGRADHLAALLLLGAMSAGFVSGVGFVPRRALPRVLLSSQACLLFLFLALLQIANH